MNWFKFIELRLFFGRFVLSCVSKEPTEEDYGDGVDYDYENSGETTEEVPSTISEVGSSTLASTPVTIAWKNDVNVVRTTTTVPFVPAQLAGVFMEKGKIELLFRCFFLSVHEL